MQGLAVLLRVTAFPQQAVALLLQVLNLRRTLFQKHLQVRQTSLTHLLCRLCGHRMLSSECGILTRLVLHGGDSLAFGGQDLTLFGQRLLSNALCQMDRLLPHRDKGLRNLRGQRRQASLAAQPFGQPRSPLIEQTTDARRATAAQFQTHAFHRWPFATG
jgi:hypothetical protein